MEELEGKGLYGRHSEEVQEMMGHIPHWIMRWGIPLMAAIVVGIGGFCYFLRYPDKVSAKVEVTASNPPVTMRSPSGGFLETYIAQGQRVRRGQPLATIRQNGNDSIVLRSPLHGVIEREPPAFSGKSVSAGDVLFHVIPDNPGNPICFGQIASSDIGKVKTGQEVRIWLEGFPESDFGFIRATVRHVSLIPGKDGSFYFEANLPPSGLVTSTKQKIPLACQLAGKAEIFIGNKRLLGMIIAR